MHSVFHRESEVFVGSLPSQWPLEKAYRFPGYSQGEMNFPHIFVALCSPDLEPWRAPVLLTLQQLWKWTPYPMGDAQHLCLSHPASVFCSILSWSHIVTETRNQCLVQVFCHAGRSGSLSSQGSSGPIRHSRPSRPRRVNDNPVKPSGALPQKND